VEDGEGCESDQKAASGERSAVYVGALDLSCGGYGAQTCVINVGAGQAINWVTIVLYNTYWNMVMTICAVVMPTIGQKPKGDTVAMVPDISKS
jgi:hypothetical protein